MAPAAKVYRVGVLEIFAMASNTATVGALRDGLRDLGYVEGRNLLIEYRAADGHPERLPDLAKDLVRTNVDVIVTRGDQAALAAKHATRTIPIVMASSTDPALLSLVARLARPGENVTGLHATPPPDVGGKRLQLLKEIVPRVSRVGVLWNPSDSYSPLVMRQTEAVARTLGIQLKSFELRRPSDVEPAFEAVLTAQVDALIAFEDSLTFTERTRIADFAAMSHLPAMYGAREFVDAGGLVAYGTDRRDLFRRAAAYVDKVLKDANPGDLPVEAPARFEVAINLKTARALGLTIPPVLLHRADHIVN